MGLFETIPYKVIKKDRSIEIREYDNVLLASTKTSVNNRYDSGFMNVFNYISGENNRSEKISMTTPVVSYEEDNQLITGFYVPRKYDKSTVPDPSSDNVYIEQLSSSIYAVIRFRGSWKKEHFINKENELREYLERYGYDISSPRYVFRYQPPFIPGIFRRNEIAFKVRKEQSERSTSDA